MAGNVLAWVSGYGRRLIPLTPYRCEQLPDDPRSLLVQHTGVWGTRSIVVTLPAEGTATIRRVGGTIISRGVVDVLTPGQRPDLKFGPAEEGWRIVCELFSVRWPQQFALESSPVFPPPFDLVGPEDSRLWIQGPVKAADCPTLEELATPDQTVLGTRTLAGRTAVELGYDLDGQPWQMVQVIVERGDGWTFFASGQGPESQRDLVLSALDDLVSDIRFPQRDTPVS
jgi:hypothetical protein